MKTIILAGGLGSRISEETETKPKPMVLINKMPILWHVMSIYASQGHTEFIIATGYKGEIIHDWVNSLRTSWSITALDTGADTQTGGRIKQCMATIPNEPIMATYGDGLANVNINQLLDFHTPPRAISNCYGGSPPRPIWRFGKP